MPIPLILGVAAAVAGLAGVGAGVHGAVKMKDASDTMDLAKSIHESSVRKFEARKTETTGLMDEIGRRELEILTGFRRFSEIMEKIHNRPDFAKLNPDGYEIPKFTPEEIEDASVGAAIILGGLGGAALGTAGGVAAAGATTAAVMALGSASTGTPIAFLAGAAANNAALAFLGGGSLAVGGGGVALGTTVLSAATLGVGLLIGGAIFSLTGSSMSDKADKAYDDAKREKDTVDRICVYLNDLYHAVLPFDQALRECQSLYLRHIDALERMVGVDDKTDWGLFTDDEQRQVQNTVLLVGLLYSMCKVKLVIQSTNEDGSMNRINYRGIEESIDKANTTMAGIS